MYIQFCGDFEPMSRFFFLSMKLLQLFLLYRVTSSYNEELFQVSASDEKVNAYITTRGIDRSLQVAHVTLAHKKSHGVPAVAVFGGVRGVSVPIQLTAFLYAENMCALEASIPKNENSISSRNEWPHITVIFDCLHARGFLASEMSLPICHFYRFGRPKVHVQRRQTIFHNLFPRGLHSV